MKNKNVLIAVIGGIVACLVCAGIIFLYPKSENNLKGNQTQAGYEEEIILGDDCSSCMSQCQGTESYCAGICADDCSSPSTPTPTATATATTTPSCGANQHWSTTENKCVCDTGYTMNGMGTCSKNSTPTPTATTVTCNPGQYYSGGSCKNCSDLSTGVYSLSPAGSTSSSQCYALLSATQEVVSAGAAPSSCASGYVQEASRVNYGSVARCTNCTIQGKVPNTSNRTCVVPATTTPTANASTCASCMAQCQGTDEYCAGICADDCPTTTPTATATTTPTPTATAQSCSSSPCCVNGVTTNVDSVCRDAAIPKTCGACPTTNPTPTATATATTRPSITCLNPAYTGSEIPIATCTNGTLSNARQTNVGSYTVTCTGTGGTDAKSCSILERCEDYDGVANCPNRCYTWGDGECHTNPKPTTSPTASASPVTDWTKIEGPCCVTTNGVSSTIEATYGCQQAVAAHQTVTEGRCPVPAIQKVTRVSASYSGTLYLTPEDLNGAGYKQVVYVAYDQSGNVIPGNKLTWSVNGGNGVVVTSSSNAGGFSVTYRGIECDKPSQTVYVRASGSGDITGSATSPSITIAADSMRYKKWTQSNYNKKNTNNYPLLSEAYATNSCYAVSGYDEATQKYAYIHNRCCGSSTPTSVTYDYCCAKTDGSDFSWRSGQSNRSCPSGYTLDETKNANTCKTVRIPACYTDSDNGFHWTDDPEASWIKVAGITSETDCKKDETPACYKDTNGEYKWGLYAKSDGYTLITAVDTEEKCNNQGACYKNNFNDYTWDTEAPKECISKNSCWVPKTDPTVGSTCKYTSQNACENVEGYKVVEGVTKPENCVSPENPACYVHGQEFVWGKYNNVKGYIKLDDILAEEYCKVPTEEACYKDPDGNYVWGEFSNTTGYKLVPSVTSLNQCNNDVPTPSTGLDVSKVVYVFMAILMAFGIGFIYYSSIMKKQNQ